MKADETIYCPYCHKYTALIVADGINSDGNRYGSSIAYTSQGKWWIGICNSCDNAVIVHQHKDDYGKWSTDRISPDPLPKPIDERIPEFIKDDLLEAHKCFSTGSFRATAMLCRRILQLICLDKGAKEDKDLYQQINELLSKGIITKDIKEWAHSVRWVGNNAAHPSLKDNIKVEKEDAEDILDLVDKTIYILYIAGSVAKNKKEKFYEKKVPPITP